MRSKDQADRAICTRASTRFAKLFPISSKPFFQTRSDTSFDRGSGDIRLPVRWIFDARQIGPADLQDIFRSADAHTREKFDLALEDVVIDFLHDLVLLFLKVCLTESDERLEVRQKSLDEIFRRFDRCDIAANEVVKEFWNLW